MIMDGQITAEQASQALSSMGISGEITYEQGQIDAPIITYTNQGGSLDSLLNENGGSISFTSAVTGHTTVDAQIPQFKGTHYTGAGITGGVGRGSTKRAAVAVVKRRRWRRR